MEQIYCVVPRANTAQYRTQLEQVGFGYTELDAPLVELRLPRGWTKREDNPSDAFTYCLYDEHSNLRARVSRDMPGANLSVNWYCRYQVQALCVSDTAISVMIDRHDGHVIATGVTARAVRSSTKDSLPDQTNPFAYWNQNVVFPL